MNLATRTRATYEPVALDYYDPARHPTCANFRAASQVFLWSRLDSLHRGGLTCEVGAGMSLVAEMSHGFGYRLHRLLIADESPEMLGHSTGWLGMGATPLIADARRMPLRAGRVDSLISILGDPYHGPQFWTEAARVLAPGGLLVFTTPSHDWAIAYRSLSGCKLDRAEFECVDGPVRLYSRILSIADQVDELRSHRFDVTEVEEVPISALDGNYRSPKLLLERGHAASVLTGYVAVRQ